MKQDENEDRTLTDADARAIARAIDDLFEERFYRNFGRGVWGLVWRALLIAAFALATWGAIKSGNGGALQ